jgi:hypothetical protein
MRNRGRSTRRRRAFSGAIGKLGETIETAKRQGKLAPATDPAQLTFELCAPLELANYPSPRCTTTRR